LLSKIIVVSCALFLEIAIWLTLPGSAVAGFNMPELHELCR